MPERYFRWSDAVYILCYYYSICPVYILCYYYSICPVYIYFAIIILFALSAEISGHSISLGDGWRPLQDK